MVLLQVLVLIPVLSIAWNVMNWNDGSKAATVATAGDRDRKEGRPALTESEMSDNDIVRSFIGKDYDDDAATRTDNNSDVEKEFESLPATDRRIIFNLLWEAGFGGIRETYEDSQGYFDRPFYPEMQNVLEDVERSRTSIAAEGSDPEYSDRVKQDLKLAVQHYISQQGEAPYKKIISSAESSSEEVKAAVVNSQNAIVEAVTKAGNPITPGEFESLLQSDASSLQIPTAWALNASQLAVFEEMKTNGDGEHAIEAYNTAFAIAVKYLEDGDLASKPGAFLKGAIDAAIAYEGVEDSLGNSVLQSDKHVVVVELLRSRFLADR